MVGEDKLRKARAKAGNVIYASWHNRMMLIVYAHRNQAINAIVSKSSDGELTSRTIRRFGFETVRGSSSSGGGPALLGILKKLAGGADAGVTPDGPRGPMYRVQAGIIHLAQKSGCPVVPVTAGASRKLFLRSWDEFMIPYPFAKAVLIYGEPVEVGGNSNLEEKRSELEERLKKITEKADAYDRR